MSFHDQPPTHHTYPTPPYTPIPSTISLIDLDTLDTHPPPSHDLASPEPPLQQLRMEMEDFFRTVDFVCWLQERCEVRKREGTLAREMEIGITFLGDGAVNIGWEWEGEWEGLMDEWVWEGCEEERGEAEEKQAQGEEQERIVKECTTGPRQTDRELELHTALHRTTSENADPVDTCLEAKQGCGNVYPKTEKEKNRGRKKMRVVSNDTLPSQPRNVRPQTTEKKRKKRRVVADDTLPDQQPNVKSRTTKRRSKSAKAPKKVLSDPMPDTPKGCGDVISETTSTRPEHVWANVQPQSTVRAAPRITAAKEEKKEKKPSWARRLFRKLSKRKTKGKAAH